MISSSDTQKNNNTHNRVRCWNQRPCHRVQSCDYCLNRKIKYICDQVGPMVCENTFCTFLTISLPLEQNPDVAILKALRLRKFLHEFLREAGPYISVVALGEATDGFTPHIHSLCGPLIKDDLEFKIVKKSPFKLFNIHIDEHHGDLVKGAKGRVGYMVKQNYRPTLYYKDKFQRLLTSSRGIYTGRPKILATAAAVYRKDTDYVL